ncbi:hypothetical protein COF68_05490 [Bacillus toyonensis]|uniref:hypothetical protein n=1 Tax=Bacillus toyonensis TaxID=155322 RepID=UPI000BFDC749|nr:hypothetical protein [Bacillus toyonensis]PHE64296.1 hypothetical protein COF68_05490 [Bacillus toyonensis]
MEITEERFKAMLNRLCSEDPKIAHELNKVNGNYSRLEPFYRIQVCNMLGVSVEVKTTYTLKEYCSCETPVKRRVANEDGRLYGLGSTCNRCDKKIKSMIS